MPFVSSSACTNSSSSEPDLAGLVKIKVDSFLIYTSHGLIIDGTPSGRYFGIPCE